MANTVAFYTILFAVARHVGKLESGLITTYSSATSMACANIGESSDDAYNGAIARLLGGTTYARVADYTGSTRTFTLASPGVSGATNARLEWVFYDGDMFAQVFEAVNEMIRSSWGTWYRETVVDRNSATITLAANTHSYALPTACAELIQIGIQPTTTANIVWYDPLDIWYVEGQEGAYTLHFNAGTVGGMYTVWNPRIQLNNGYDVYGSFADAWTTQPLCLRYYEKEAEITTETQTIQLPLDYAAWRTAEIYLTALLANADQNTQRVLNTFLPQTQQNALRASARLRITKPPRHQTVKLRF